MASKFQCRILSDPPDLQQWHGHWPASGTSNLGQHPGFLKALAGDGVDAVAYGIFRDSGALVGILPFARMMRRGAVVLRHPSPAPFAGILLRNEAEFLSSESSLRDLLQSLEVLGSHASRCTVIFPASWQDLRALQWSGWRVEPHYNYLSMVLDDGSLDPSMDNNARRQAAKARAAGLVLEPMDSLEDIRPLRDATVQHQQFTDAVTFDAYVRLFDWARSDAAIVDGIRGAAFAVRAPGGPVQAGALLLADRQRTYYVLGASDPVHFGSGAPSLLHEEIARHIARAGWPRTYDWCGANTPAVVAFKRSFRPRLELTLRAEWRGAAARAWDLLRGRT